MTDVTEVVSGVVNTPHYWPVLHQQTIAQTSSCDSSQTQADMYCAVVTQSCPGGTLWAALQQGHFHNTPCKLKSDSQAGQKSCCWGVWPCLALPCQQQQTASAEGALATALGKASTPDKRQNHSSFVSWCRRIRACASSMLQKALWKYSAASIPNTLCR